MMKKSIMFLLVLTLILGIFSGCGQDADESNDGETASTNSASENESTTEEKITIKFLTWQNHLEEGDNRVVEAYEKENPNVNVVFEYYGDRNVTEYGNKVDLMIMAGDEMDILGQAGYGGMAEKAMAGVYYPMDEFIEAEGIEIEDVYSFTPRVEGSIYGLPADVKSFFVMLNKDLLDAAGLDVPPLDWTWEDYREYAIAMTQGEGPSKVYGSYFHTWGVYAYLVQFNTQYNNPLSNPDGGFYFDDPALIEWNKYRKELENVDGASRPYADSKAMNANYRTEFFNGQAAMIPTGSWMIPEVDDIDKYPHDFVTTFAPLPRWSDGGTEGLTNTDSHFYSIAAHSKHPEEAYKFLRFYTTEGMEIRGGGLSAEVGVDKMEMVKSLMDIPELYDIEALGNVLNNPEWKDNIITYAPPYGAALDTMVIEEAEKYYLDVITAEELVENWVRNAERIEEDNE
jgi:multiple sugar transport system substrate-binding protein